MKRFSITTAILFFGFSSGILAKNQLWTLPHSAAVYLEQNEKKQWGLTIESAGDAFFSRKEPVSIEIYKDGAVIETLNAGYDRFTEKNGSYLKTNDAHYYDVALLLLHNTKTMVTLPGRDLGLKGTGWMQEHWSMGPTRGVGLCQNWNPWLASSQLNGIQELEELDKELYKKMTDKDHAAGPGAPIRK